MPTPLRLFEPQSSGRHRTNRRARRKVLIDGVGTAGEFMQQTRRDVGAIASLTAPHPETGVALDRRQGVVAGGQLGAHRTKSDIFTAAQQCFIRDLRQVKFGGLEDRPESALEVQRSPQRLLDGPRRLYRVAQLTRRGIAGQRTARERHARTAQIGAITDHEDPWDAGGALFVGRRCQIAEVARHKSVLTAQHAGEFDGRDKAVADA